MDERSTCMIWCEDCTRENWDDVSTWKWAGRAVTRSGKLRVSDRCASCDAELSEGDSVEGITLYHTTPEAARWMDEVLMSDRENEALEESGASPMTT